MDYAKIEGLVDTECLPFKEDENCKIEEID